MAKVIDCYAAEAGGSSTMYYYRYPDNTSEATRIYTGEAIYLPADYGNRMSGSMYPLQDPEGWIHWYHVQNITPVYKTVADACTAPSEVRLDAAAQTLVIIGGAGGDLNAWTGFGVSWRDRAISSSAWGSWSADMATASRTVSVSVRGGMVRQFRVRTLGEAGVAYYSAYTVCETLLNGNTAAGTPVILLPVSGADTCAAKVMISIHCPAEPDGDAMTLQRSMDGGAWTAAASLNGQGGTVYDLLSVNIGAHTVRYRLMDANGESGGEDSISFTRSPLVWTRTISTGDVIASRQISFQADIREMLDCVNRLCAFYGRSAVVLPGTVGRFADWQSQLKSMQQAVDGCRTASGRTAWGFAEPSAWPAAADISQLRAAIADT